MHIVVNSIDILDINKSYVDECTKCLEIKTALFTKKNFVEKEVYDKLVKSYSTLENHCISLDVATQLNQEIFQRDNCGETQNVPTFNQLFEINELKAQSQEKDTVIRKLKDKIKYLSGKDCVENVKKDFDEIETINIKLEHSVAKLLSENENLRKEREHLKSIYKDQFDTIKKIQLKNELRKLKGKNVVDSAVSKPITSTIAPGMYKLDIQPISYRLKNNNNALVKHSVRNAKFESMCAIYNKCLFDATHDMCLIDHVNDVNVYSKSKSIRNKKRKLWKTMGKVFNKIGYSWKPTGRNFTIIGNRRPKATRSVGSNSKVKIVDSNTPNTMEPNQS
nr:hypothetical protein [Tanacetum cinerariifolium]